MLPVGFIQERKLNTVIKLNEISIKFRGSFTCTCIERYDIKSMPANDLLVKSIGGKDINESTLSMVIKINK